MTVFDDMAQALADRLNTTAEAAGFILGFSTIAVFMVAFAILFATLRVRVDAMSLAVPVFVGIAFVGLVAWWPPWAVLLIVVLVAVLLARTFQTGTGD